MLVLKLIRFIFGYVKFTASGGFPERFLNLCRLRGIALWDVRSDGETLTGFADRSAYKKLRHIAKSSGMRMRISKKFGLSFFLNRHSRRVGVIAGICIMSALITVLSTRIWSITVTGNSRIPTEEIIEAFEKAGVRCGTAAKKIVPSEAELEVQRSVEGISWVNVNIRGSSAFVEVRETVEAKVEDNDGSPSNMVAACDGVLVILRTFGGSAEEKAGSPVLKGDLLISGITQNRDLSFNFCRADGYAVAKTEKKICSAVKRSIHIQKTENVKTAVKIGFFSLELPLGKISGDNVFSLKSSVCINGVTLPIYCLRDSIFSRNKSETVLDKNQCRLLALSDYFSKCSHTLKYVKAETVRTEKSETDDGFSITADIKCLENIGEIQPMEVE